MPSFWYPCHIKATWFPFPIHSIPCTKFMSHTINQISFFIFIIFRYIFYNTNCSVFSWSKKTKNVEKKKNKRTEYSMRDSLIYVSIWHVYINIFDWSRQSTKKQIISRTHTTTTTTYQQHVDHHWFLHIRLHNVQFFYLSHTPILWYLWLHHSMWKYLSHSCRWYHFLVFVSWNIKELKNYENYFTINVSMY